MKPIVSTILIILCSLSLSAQFYSIDTVNFDGNPGGLNTDNDNVNTGWTDITLAGAVLNTWSPVQNIPFNFTYFNDPVSQVAASLNGVVAFTASNSIIVPGPNENLPSNQLPDQSISVFWDEFTNTPPIGGNDQVYTKTFGTAPNRQFWMKWFSFEMGNPSSGFNYFACALEETTHKIYVIDMSFYADSLSTTIGLQKDTATFQQYAGPNYNWIGSSNDSYTDNSYIVFSPRPDIGVSKLIAPVDGRELTSSELSSSETVTIEISNYSPTASGLYNAYFEFEGNVYGPEPVASIPPNGTITHSFATMIDVSAVKNHEINAWAVITDDRDQSNDTLRQLIKHVQNPIISFPYIQGFEKSAGIDIQQSKLAIAGAIIVDFENTDSRGRLRTEAGPNYYKSGNAAATLDADPSGSVQVNFLTLTWNLSNKTVNDSIRLDFSLMHHGDESHTNDRVWVRGSDIDPWIEILNWNTSLTTSGQYFSFEDFSLNRILQSNGQNFSTSTQLRFGQEDNFPSTSITASDGLTVDDIRLRELSNINTGVSAIINPINNACGDSNMVVEVIVSNYGLTAQNNIPVNVVFSNAVSGAISSTLLVSIAPFSSDTLFVGTFNTFNGGDIDLTAYTKLPGDTISEDDSSTISVTILPLTIPTAPDVSTCKGDTAVLIASNANPNVVFAWYDAPAGGTLLEVGSTLKLPGLISNAQAFVESFDFQRFSVGPDENSFGGGANYTTFSDGLRFNALQSFQLDSVLVYPLDTGIVSVRLLDNGGNVLDSTGVMVYPISDNAPVQIPVQFLVDAGNGYQLDALGTTTGGLFRNSSGANFPYTDGKALEIIETINQLSGYYYFFYDWKITGQGCIGPRISVSVNVFDTIPEADFDYNQNLSTFFFKDSSDNAVSYLWDFGDGNTSTERNPEHTYSTPGMYTVCLSSSNPCGNDMSCQQVDAFGVGISSLDHSTVKSNIFPNPNTGTFIIQLSAYDPLDELQIQLCNLSGLTMYSYELFEQSNQLNLTIETNHLPSGTYLVSVTNRRFVHQEKIIIFND